MRRVRVPRGICGLGLCLSLWAVGSVTVGSVTVGSVTGGSVTGGAVTTGGWLAAAQAAPADDLSSALRLQELALLIRDEGVEDARGLLPPGPSGQLPSAVMTEIETLFEPERVRTEIETALATGMRPQDQAEAAAFFDGPAGRDLTTLELVARRAMSDPDVEAIARSDWAMRQGDDEEKIRLIKRFVAVNDLIERNTTSAMTARYHFLRGLAEGSGEPVDDDTILTGVWSGEAAIREDTESWVMGYLLMAYGPAGTDDLRAYVAFSETAAGQAMNAALFQGFETAYGRISEGLGRITGRSLTARDL